MYTAGREIDLSLGVLGAGAHVFASRCYVLLGGTGSSRTWCGWDAFRSAGARPPVVVVGSLEEVLCSGEVPVWDGREGHTFMPPAPPHYMISFCVRGPAHDR